MFSVEKARRLGKSMPAPLLALVTNNSYAFIQRQRYIWWLFGIVIRDFRLFKVGEEVVLVIHVLVIQVWGQR